LENYLDFKTLKQSPVSGRWISFTRRLLPIRSRVQLEIGHGLVQQRQSMFRRDQQSGKRIQLRIGGLRRRITLFWARSSMVTTIMHHAQTGLNLNYIYSTRNINTSKIDFLSGILGKRKTTAILNPNAPLLLCYNTTVIPGY
jgi:hypothetical protein